MTKQVLYTYLGTNGVLTTPIHLEGIYSVKINPIFYGLADDEVINITIQVSVIRSKIWIIYIIATIEPIPRFFC